MTKPILVRDDGTCGPAALKMIEEMAAEHKTQGSIAVALGIPRKKFKDMLEKNKGDNPERLAWEAGFARFEQHVTDVARGAALGSVIEEPMVDEKGNPVIDPATGKRKTEKVRVLSKTNTIALIWFTKAQLGWSEKQQTTLQDNRINITLPAPLTREQMFERLGIQGPLDFSKMKDVTPKGDNVKFQIEAPKEKPNA